MISFIAYIWSAFLGCFVVSRMLPQEFHMEVNEYTVNCLCADCESPAANGLFCGFHTNIIGPRTMQRISESSDSQAKQLVDAVVSDLEELSRNAEWN